MPFEGIKKWCYQSEQNYGESMSKLALQMPLKSICVDLSNPLTRLKNKYKMVVPHEQDGPNPTGICTLSQMRALGFLVKHVR